jgi:Kdo2-lipid IVA lauroyltransferase/acyltransferase
MARLETGVMATLLGIGSIVPPLWAARLGAGLGWLLFAVFRFRRRVVLSNLDAAYGSTLSPEEKRRITKRCFQHFGSMFVEMLGGFPATRSAPPEFDSKLMDELLAQGKGVIVFTGHFGSWELFGAACAARGYPMTAYGGRLANAAVDSLVNSRRRELRIEVLLKSDSLRTMVKTLRSGRILGLVADQHESTKRYFVRFFGHPVSVSPGPYRLAALAKAPTVFGACIRQEGLRWKLITRPIAMPTPTGDDERDLLTYAQACFNELEAEVRAHPEQYLWMHHRFRPLVLDEYLSPGNRAFLGM